LIIKSNDWYGKFDTIEIKAGSGAAIRLDSAVAYDGRNVQSGIDYDDYVKLFFNYPVMPLDTSTINLDSILMLNDGHTWYDGSGEVKQINFTDDSTSITIRLSTDTSLPTISIGDYIYPDSITITDERGYSFLKNPVILKGSFGPSGISDITNKDIKDNISIKNNTIYYSVSDQNTRFSIIDVLGRTVHQSKTKTGANRYDTNELKSGIYFIQVKSDESVISKTFIKVE